MALKVEEPDVGERDRACPTHTLPPAPAPSCLTAGPAAYFAAQALGARHLGGQLAVNKGLANCVSQSLVLSLKHSDVRNRGDSDQR